MGSEAVEVITALRLYKMFCFTGLEDYDPPSYTRLLACFCIVFTYNFDNQGLLLVQNFDDTGRLRLIL